MKARLLRCHSKRIPNYLSPGMHVASGDHWTAGDSVCATNEPASWPIEWCRKIYRLIDLSASQSVACLNALINWRDIRRSTSIFPPQNALEIARVYVNDVFADVQARASPGRPFKATGAHLK